MADPDDPFAAGPGDYEPGMDERLDAPIAASPDEELPAGAFDGDVEGWCACQPTNDLGNARRFVRRHGADVLYQPEVGFHVWSGGRWDRAQGAFLAQRRAQETADAIRGEARKIEPDDPQRAKMLREHAHASGGSGRIAAMQKEAVPHLLVRGAELDANALLVTCENGTLELALPLVLREHRREDRITRKVRARYDTAAQCPCFESFIAHILQDEAVRGFVQRWFGYGLTGDTREQVIVMLLGDGSNGKSTLLRLLAAVADELHEVVDIATFKHESRRSGSEATPDIARLPGVRMVTATEPEVGFTLSEARVKLLSGGERVAARHLNRDIFEFEPQCKITLAFNNLPKIRGQDHGTRRRFLMVRFTERVGPNQVGPVLAALEAERDGIFRWLLDGAEQWLEAGLQVPDAVRAATAEFMAAQGGLQQFLSDCCHAGEGFETARTRMKELYRVWCAWCKEQGEDPGSANLLGRRLTESGFVREKSGDVFYKGLELAPAWRDAGAGGAAAGDGAAGAPVDGYPEGYAG